MAQQVSQEFVDNFFSGVFGMTKKAGRARTALSSLFRYGMGGGIMEKIIPKRLLPGLRSDVMRWNRPAAKWEKNYFDSLNLDPAAAKTARRWLRFAPPVALGGAAYGVHALAPDSVVGQVAKWAGPWAGTPLTAALVYGARGANHIAEEASKRTTDKAVEKVTNKLRDKAKGMTDYVPIWGDDLYGWFGKKIQEGAQTAQDKARVARDREFRSFRGTEGMWHGIMNAVTGSAFE